MPWPPPGFPPCAEGPAPWSPPSDARSVGPMAKEQHPTARIAMRSGLEPEITRCFDAGIEDAGGSGGLLREKLSAGDRRLTRATAAVWALFAVVAVEIFATYA